ncbi:MAG: hypothetical protein ACKOX6_04255 [Bdellovibrio sp.]
MLRSYNVSIVVGAGIPILAYFSWVAYFSYTHSLLDTANPDTVVNFAITTSAIGACISLVCHVGYCTYYIRKLNTTMNRLHEMNSHVQALSEDLSEVTNYNLELVTEVMNAAERDPACTKKAGPALRRITELAEEMSLRADKAAIAIDRVDGQIKRLVPRTGNKTSKLARLWESAYYYR